MSSNRAEMKLQGQFAPFVLAVCLGLINLVEARSENYKNLSLEAKETTTANFIRLVVMRLIFGIASAMGYGEGLSNFLGGIFVPPGADYEDDYDYVPNLF